VQRFGGSARERGVCGNPAREHFSFVGKISPAAALVGRARFLPPVEAVVVPRRA